MRNKYQKYTTESFIEKANIIHNNFYDYSLVNYVNNRTKILIQHLKCGNKFEQSPSNHISGKKCPFCFEFSKGEIVIKKFLLDNNIKFERQKTFIECKLTKLLRFDFYLPDYNMCIEYNGCQHYKAIQWFGGEKTLQDNIKRDKIKKNYCDNNLKELFIIKYDDFKNINNILYEKFFKKLYQIV